MLARLVGKTFMLSTNLSGPQLRLGEDSEAEVAVVALLDRGLRGFGAPEGAELGPSA